MATTATRKPRQRRTSTQATHRGVLGINVTAETIEAALLKQTGNSIAVVKRFTRPRTLTTQLVGAKNLVTALPGLKSSEDADYTLEVGDGSASSVDFLPSEFEGLGKKGGKKAAEELAQKAHTHPFASQLKEILAECKALGFAHVDLTFSVAPPDVNYVELKLPPVTEKPSGKSKARGRTTSADEETDRPETKPGHTEPLTQNDRKRLLQILPDHHPGKVEANRVAFVPLTSSGESRRVLAVVGDPTEPVSATLKLLKEQSGNLTATTPRFVNAEASVYHALFSRHAMPDPSERSAIVRVGSEDTLVLFFEGTSLSHLDRLRSLSVFDLPETICSRVILQQDEKKIGDLHSLYLVDGGRSEKLLSAFRSYFPNAAVEPLKSLFGDESFTLNESDEEPLRASVLPAISVALAGVEKWSQTLENNLLPRELSKKQGRKFGIAWHTIAAAVLVLAIAVFGVLRFTTTQQRINEEREELRLNPPTLPLENPDLLQARVDSLSNTYATYTRALTVLDSLLIGSDQWIQMLSMVTRTVSSSGNTWITKWTPESGVLRLNGSSLSRLNIVDLSRRLNAAIEQVTYEDIGNRRVYNFEMVTVIPVELPEAASYLRGALPPVEYSESDMILYAAPPMSEPHSH
ncbi:MAG: hypothetical protein R3284_05925 [Rubricoccaceae bacterium]|nr:hypothetical protein [Rubricoccaceae bacterium]